LSARRPWAWPLVPVYAAVLGLKEKLRQMGSAQVRSLAWPVVSVGSISAGGAGKTPVVIALARLLHKHGRQVDVLSRGYGREGSAIGLVDVQKLDAARLFGDEPVLIAQTTGLRVWVGADRFAVGRLAESAAGELAQGEADSSATLRNDNKKSVDDGKESVRDGEESGHDDSKNDGPKNVHLLDDGFQHRRLKRDVDIALVTDDDLSDALLPAGNLREPLNALKRADVVVIREEERALVEARVSALMREGALLWSVRRGLRFPAPLGVLSAGLRPLAFCAIARPEGFARMLQEAGCGVIDTVIFKDHHGYSLSDVEQVVEIAQRLNASGLMTTEKDAVKLSPALRARLEVVGPLVVVELEAEFVYPERVARELEARLG
jgi:tetraacyldisaccharide 4'-kinase